MDLILNKTGLTREAILDRAEAAIVTLGEHGSQLYADNSEVKIAPFKAQKVVDPTGCGDAYRGGLISGLIAGRDLPESARLGSVCASFAVECYGTQVYSFTTEEFNERLQKGG